MKENTKKILINILIFIIYISFSYVFDFFVRLFNIDLSNLKYIYKIIIIYLLEIIPLLFMLFIYRKDLKEKFKPFKDNFMAYADKYIRWWMAGIVLMAISNLLITLITSSTISNNEEVVRQITNILPIYSIISVCICAPLVEELVFRKTIRNIFKKKWLCIIASGVIFGAVHVIGTYEVLSDILYVIPYGIIGSIFMYIYIDSDNIWTTISLHFLHNTILLILQFINSAF